MSTTTVRRGRRAAVTDDRVREILRTVQITGLHLALPDQLDPREYTAVNTILTALGGRWHSRQRVHVFTVDPAPALAAYLAGSAAPRPPQPPRTTEGYVPTPPALAAEILRLHTDIGDLDPATGDQLRVLEPSAGDGVFVHAILGVAPRPVAIEVLAIEPNPERARLICRDRPDPRVTVLIGTLEQFCQARRTRLAHDGPQGSELRQFDLVVMNPPFAVPGRSSLWIDHLTLAWDLLAPGGTMVAIVPESLDYRRDRRHDEIRDLIESHGAHRPLAPGAFTSVHARVAWAEKP